MDSFSIKEEKFIDDIYYVKLDVSFNKKRIYSILEKQNVFPSLPQKKSILFIPILIDEEKKNIVLFSENIFFQQWLDRIDKNHQLNYVLPVEDLDDIKIIPHEHNYKNIPTSLTVKETDLPINVFSEELLFGYQFGYELLIFNGLLTFIALYLISYKPKHVFNMLVK